MKSAIASIALLLVSVLFVPRTVVAVISLAVLAVITVRWLARELRLFLRVRRVASDPRPGELPIVREAFMEKREIDA